MKKITFLLLFFFIVIFSGNAQVLIGTGDNVSQFAPFKPYWRYSYTQTIYLKSQINASGTITSIEWYFDGTTAIPNSDKIVLYMGTTSKTSFASENDWIPISNMTMVFDGTINMNSPIGAGWKTVTLSTPFYYDGNSNLVIATDENNPGTESPDLGQNFFNSAVAENQTIYKVDGTNDIFPASPPSANNIRAFVPNIIINGIAPACEAPQNLTTTNITTTSASVRWQNLANTIPSGGSQYYVSPYSTAPDANTSPSGSVPNGSYSADMTGLLSGTTYFVWVRNNCTSEFSLWSPFASFTTNCPTSVSTFYENCDNNNTQVPNLPNCWTKILRANNGTLCPSARVESIAGGFAYSPNNSIFLQNCNSTGNYDIMLVSPAISNLDKSPNRLLFYSRGGVIEVGTLDNNTENSTFTVFKTYTTSSQDYYTQYEIKFSGYSGSDQYIGIRMQSDLNPQQQYTFIDNLSWSKNPTCPDVTQVNVVSVTSNTATIGWSEGAKGDSWDIAVGPLVVTDPTLLPFVNTKESGSYELTGLEPNTSYKAWVRSVCGTGNNTDNGDYIGPVTFRTDCPTVTGFSENFNSTPIGLLPECWSKILRNTNPNANVETVNINVFESTKSVVLKTDNSQGDFDVILVSPRTSKLSAGSNYRLRFLSRFTTFSGNQIEIGTLDTNTDSATFTLFEIVKINVSGALAEYKVDFSTYSGTDEYIGIRIPNVEGQGFDSITLDNIVWQPVPTCPEISDVTVIKTTETSATFDWLSTPTESSWDVSYGPTTATNPDIDNLPIENTFIKPYEINSLSSGTSYKVWVRANCEGENKGTGEWIGPVTFSTECVAIGSFTENFDSTTTPNLPTCWSKILRPDVGLLSQYATITTSNVYSPYDGFVSPKLSAPNHANINCQGSSEGAQLILVSPKIYNLQGKNRLKFDTYYPGTIEIGTLDGNTSTAKFTPLTTIVLKSEVIGQNIYGDSPVINIDNYRGSDTYLGIRLINHIGEFASIFIDNVVWEPIPGCQEVFDVKVTNTTITTATVEWKKGGKETNWEIGYGTLTDTEPNPTTIVSTTTPSYLIPDLTSGTTYNVWVRAVCGGVEGNSAWSKITTFTTKCENTNIPYIQTFNSAVLPNLPVCTSQTQAGYGNIWETTEANIYGYDSQLLRYVGINASANTWFFTQGINLNKGENYTIKYEYGSNANAQISSNNLKVMYGTSDTPSGMTLQLADYKFFYGNKKFANINFTPPSTGVYYFGWNVYSPAAQGFVFLDNIEITINLSNTDFDLNQFSYYPNPVKDVLNLTYIKDITAVSVYNIIGQKVLTQSNNGNITKVDMSALSKGTYMVKIVSDNQIKTLKVLKE